MSYRSCKMIPAWTDGLQRPPAHWKAEALISQLGMPCFRFTGSLHNATVDANNELMRDTEIELCLAFLQQ